MLSNKKAFTLIELLVVVLIIGILAAVAVPQYQIAVIKARVMSLVPIMKSISNAQQVYKLANGEYATSFDELDIELPAGGTWQDNTHKQMNYQGFVCHFGGSDSRSSVYCNSTAVNAPQFEKYFSQQKFMCWAAPDRKVANNVCRAISGREKSGFSEISSRNYYNILL